MRNALVASILPGAAPQVHGADAVVPPGNIEGVGLYGGSAILVHRTPTRF